MKKKTLIQAATILMLIQLTAAYTIYGDNIQNIGSITGNGDFNTTGRVCDGTQCLDSLDIPGQPNIDWSNITTGTNPLASDVSNLWTNATAQQAAIAALNATALANMGTYLNYTSSCAAGEVYEWGTGCITTPTGGSGSENATNLISDNPILIKPSGDTDNYFSLSSDGTDLTLATTDTSDLIINPSSDYKLYLNEALSTLQYVQHYRNVRGTSKPYFQEFFYPLDDTTTFEFSGGARLDGVDNDNYASLRVYNSSVGGDLRILNAKGSILLMPNKDTDDYLSFTSDGSTPAITDVGGSQMKFFTSGQPKYEGRYGTSDYYNYFNLFDGYSTYGGMLLYNVSGGTTPNSLQIYHSAGSVDIKPSGDTDDYLSLSTVSNVPYIKTVGGGASKITSDLATAAGLYITHTADAAGDAYLYFENDNGANGINGIRMNSGGDGLYVYSNDAAGAKWLPSDSTYYYLGNDAYEWKEVWAVDTSINHASLWMRDEDNEKMYHVGVDEIEGLVYETIDYKDLAGIYEFVDQRYENETDIIDTKIWKFKEGKDFNNLRTFIKDNPNKVKKVSTKKMLEDQEALEDILIEKGIATKNEIDTKKADKKAGRSLYSGTKKVKDEIITKKTTTTTTLPETTTTTSTTLSTTTTTLISIEGGGVEGLDGLSSGTQA